jgi:signal transduction histidine kinase
MKLARRLTLFLILGISLVMSLNAYLRVRQETAAIAADAVRDLRVLGRGLAYAVEVIWRNEGQERAEKFVRELNLARDDVEIRWVDPGRPDDANLVAMTPADLERLAQGRVVHLVSHDESDGDRRYSYTPMSLGGRGPVALLEISESMHAEEEYLRTSQLLVFVVALGIVGVCSVIVIAVGYWFVGRPMRLLTDKARRVGAGDLSQPLALGQRDEIGELAREIDAMCDRLAQANETAAAEGAQRMAAIEQLRHADRLKTVGQLASGVAHELGTPLNVISGHARMISSGDLDAEEVRASAAVVSEQSERMTRIIRQLLDFSRRRGALLDTLDLRGVVARTLDMVAPLADRRGIRVTIASPDHEVPIRGDENQVCQALANIVVNAFQAMGSGGELRVAVASRAAQPPPDIDGGPVEMAVVDVTDQGPGISPQDLPHMFEPFFTTKEVGEGAGLGLAVAHGIVREHGGWIAVDSRRGEGSCFSIYLRQPEAGGKGASEWTSTAVAS